MLQLHPIAMSMGGEKGRQAVTMGTLGGGFRAVVAIIILLCTGTLAVNAELTAFDEYAVKAGFVYNFAKFVEWPASAFRDAQAPLVVCVVGQDPFGSKLNTLENKTISGRKLVIKRMATSEDLERCHVLFISSSENAWLSDILKAARNRNILTISEAPDFCRSGGTINLFLDGDRVRFEINIRNAEKAGLKISSHLLSLAKICREDN